MSDDDDDVGGKDEGASLPGWIITFSDLMSLLLAFFVLLFSFSEIDKNKYKMVGGALKNAFGVQREVRVMDPIKGISLIATEFSAGRPEMTVVNQVRQQQSSQEHNLQINTPAVSPVAPPKDSLLRMKESSSSQKNQKDQSEQKQQTDSTDNKNKEDSQAKKQSIVPPIAEITELKQSIKEMLKDQKQKDQKTKSDTTKKKEAEEVVLKATPEKEKVLGKDKGAGKKDFKEDKTEKFRQKINGNAQALKLLLGPEITEGYVDILVEDGKLIIRLTEKGSFAAGSDELIGNYKPILYKISSVLKSMEGDIQVAGHSDSSPMVSDRFRSNWGLSAARAVTVAHELLSVTGISPERFQVQGYSDTRPIAKNDTAQGRARNRRVEIVVMPPDLEEEEDAAKLSDQIGQDQVKISPEETPAREKTPGQKPSVAIPSYEPPAALMEKLNQSDLSKQPPAKTENDPAAEIRSLRRKEVTLEDYPTVGSQDRPVVKKDFIFGTP